MVKPNIWGGASAKDIEKVLNSSVRQIWPHVLQKKISPIRVERSQTGPIVLYRRGEFGEYQVRLNSEKTFWSQYAFQFAHEFGHIICGFKEGNRSNLWFEETLCETASLFALRRMTKEWKTKPLFPERTEYGKEFAKYAQNRLEKFPWPQNQTLAEWYSREKNSLSNKPTQRDRNVRLASQLLPYFEANPSLWGSCAFINVNKSDKKRSFVTYLMDWKKNCLELNHKKFVGQLIIEFGLNE